MSDDHWPDGAYAAEFSDERSFAGALALLREDGYTKLEGYTPYEVRQIEPAMRHAPSPLPLLTFFGGAAGGTAGYVIQYYASVVAYPLNIGGRPINAIPAFLIPTFEGAVLGAALAAFVGMFAMLRLPRLWHPFFEVDGYESAAVDRYWIAIDASDARGTPDLIANALRRFAPRRVVFIPPEGDWPGRRT